MSRTVPLLTRFEDPATSRDPRVRSVVEKLGAVDYAPAPRPEFRSELRAQLVAITARVVAESDADRPATLDPVAAAEAARSATVTPIDRGPVAPRRSAGRRVGRPLGLAAACCAVLALGLGGAVWKSRSALPGDALYGLKRTSESVQLSLASGNTARGHDYLKLASIRVQEARDLLGQTSAMASGSGVQAAGLSPSTVSLIRSTLSSADSDVTSGSSLLGTAAVQSHSTTPLSIMTGWAPGQLHQLSELASAIGTGPARASTLQTRTLVARAYTRARTLQPQVTSSCTAARTDALGPVACSHAAQRSAPASSPTRHATTPARRHGSTSPSRHGAATSAPGSTAPSRGADRTSHPSTGRSHGGGSSTAPAGLLPSLQPATPPVSINSCGITAQLGPIGVTLGSCPTAS